MVYEDVIGLNGFLKYSEWEQCFMNDWIQWGISLIVGILGFFIGREWEKRDRKAANDREVLKKLQELLPSETAIFLIRETDFGGAFSQVIFDDFNRFINYSDEPGFFFLDKELEELRLDLFTKVKRFNNRLSSESFPLLTGVEFSRIKAPHEYPDPKKYHELKIELNNLASEVRNSYTLLVKSAKRKLY